MPFQKLKNSGSENKQKWINSEKIFMPKKEKEMLFKKGLTPTAKTLDELKEQKEE